MKSRKIDVITNQLAAYFGTITKAAFVAEMLDPTYDPSSDFFQPPTPNASAAFISLNISCCTLNLA